MSKRPNKDPLVAEIQSELMPGQFFRHEKVSGLVDNLERVHEKLQALVKGAEPARGVRLYEILLAGTYAKIEEADDECYLAMLFQRLTCGWIRARQAAGLPAEETVSQVLNWMKNDKYGFCYRLEKEVIKALDRKGRLLFIGHFQALVRSGRRWRMLCGQPFSARGDSWRHSSRSSPTSPNAALRLPSKLRSAGIG